MIAPGKCLMKGSGGTERNGRIRSGKNNYKYSSLSRIENVKRDPTRF